jgi:hypothetical protein
MDLLTAPFGEPIYGLSANVARPPVAALLSIAMALGVDWIGLVALQRLQLGYFSRWPWLRWQAAPIGAALLAATLFPMALAGLLPRIALQPLALATAIAGIVHGCRNFRRFVQYIRLECAAAPFPGAGRFEAVGVLFWLSVVGLGLLALGPITEADALNYHVGVALHILNTGSFPFVPTWFSSRLAGAGEILIAMGLSIGAEQFGSLLQYSGVLGLVGIFQYGLILNAPEDPWLSARWRKIVALAAISTPVLIPWVASPKPLLLPVAMTTAALMVAVSMIAKGREDLSHSQQRHAFVLVCLLVMVAAASKMNFLLSGAVVGLIALRYMMSLRQTKFAVVSGVIAGLLIIIPAVIWKHIHFGGALIDSLLTLFPGHWPGTDMLQARMLGYNESNIAFPFSMLVPSGLGLLTTVLGFGLFLTVVALWKPRGHETITIVAAGSVVSVVGAILGQGTARFFLEPYLWLLMATLLQQRPLSKSAMKWIAAGVGAQSILVLGMIGIGVASLTTGALSVTLRESTMERHANAYAMMRWADSVLPSDANLLIDSRSIALAPRRTIASEWQWYLSPSSVEAKIYADTVIAQRGNFLLISTPVGERPVGSNCEISVFAGPFRAHIATRNPFNSGAQYDAWILRTDSHQPCR